MEVRPIYLFVALIAVDSFLLIDLELDGMSGDCDHNNILLLILVVLLITWQDVAVQFNISYFLRYILRQLLLLLLLLILDLIVSVYISLSIAIFNFLRCYLLNFRLIDLAL